MFLPKTRPSNAMASRLYVCTLSRLFTSGCAISEAKLPPRLVLKEQDLEEAFLKGTGPGGQKIVCPLSPTQQIIHSRIPTDAPFLQNKTSSAVQLKHIPTGTVTKCQATRSRSQNRKIARRLLAEKIETVTKGPESRMAIKAEIKSRKKASKGKKARRKHRAAQEGNEDADGRGEEKVEDRGNARGEESREERV